MTVPLRALLEQAMALPEDERAELAGLLLESLEPDEPELSDEAWHEAWSAELDRRARELDAGAPTIDADEVLAKVRARIPPHS